MPRDHLLGCQAFLPPEPEPEDSGWRNPCRNFPLGYPQRLYRDTDATLAKSAEAEQQITAFEEFDHTPPEMQDDFSRGYDLATMPDETAIRLAFPYHKGMLVPEEYEALARFYDAELQRLCGVVR